MTNTYFENNNNKSRVSPNIITWMIFNQTLTCCRRFEFPTIFSVEGNYNNMIN